MSTRRTSTESSTLLASSSGSAGAPQQESRSTSVSPRPKPLGLSCTEGVDPTRIYSGAHLNSFWARSLQLPHAQTKPVHSRHRCRRGCAEDGDSTADTGSEPENPDGPEAAVTLDNCPAELSDDVAPFFVDYFACSDLATAGSGTRIATDGLPPHLSPYYAEDDPNWTEFDDRGGTHMQNRNVIGAGDYEFIIPDAPVAKGITIDASMVDNEMGTNAEEYTGGSVGVALDGVIIFAAMAAPGTISPRSSSRSTCTKGTPRGRSTTITSTRRGRSRCCRTAAFRTAPRPGRARSSCTASCATAPS